MSNINKYRKKTMDSKSKVIEAVKNNDLENIKRLVEQGANLHADDEEALQWAAEKGHLEVVKYLLERGANLRACVGWALRWAARNGHLKVVEYLLEKGANLHAENDHALRLAAGKGHLEVVKYLLEQGAESDRVSKQLLVKLFVTCDLRIGKITPRLTSLLLGIEKENKISMRNKILSTYKKKFLSSLIILMYHFYYRPSGPGFFQAIE